MFECGTAPLAELLPIMTAMEQNRKQPISIWSFRSARDSGRSDEVNLTAGSDPKPVDALGCRSSEDGTDPFTCHGSGSTTRTSERSRLHTRGSPACRSREHRRALRGRVTDRPQQRPEANSDDVIFRENRYLAARKPQFATEDFDVVLSNQRCPPRDPPGRSVIDCRLAGVCEAAAELRVPHFLPEPRSCRCGSSRSCSGARTAPQVNPRSCAAW